jgi:RHS repeat-associated protein
LDRLISHKQLVDSECQRFYCESRLVTETEGREHSSIVYHGDLLLAEQQRNLDNSLIATDQQCSVLNVLQANHLQAIAYSPYGNHPSGSGLSSLLGFNGQRPDPVTGHYLLGNGYRAFNPVLMRFNGPDSLSPFESGGLNCYAYCQGDPVNMTDPSGHSRIARFNALRQALNLTLESGVSYKPVSDIYRVSSGIHLSVDTYRGGNRLVIGGHGLPGNIEVDDGRLLGAEGLYKFLETKGVNVKKFDSVRMMSCYSADLDSYLPSLAESFARISGRDVKGYHGKILTNRQSVFKGIEVGGRSSMVRLLSINKGHDEESEAYLRKMGGTYNSQTFPARKLAESNHDVRK